MIPSILIVIGEIYPNIYVIIDNNIYPFFFEADLYNKVITITQSDKDLSVIKDEVVKKMGSNFYEMNYILMEKGEIISYITNDDNVDMVGAD